MGFLFGSSRRSRWSLLPRIPFLRFLGPGLGGSGILVAAILFLTGHIDLSSLDALRNGTAVQEGPAADQRLPPVQLAAGKKSEQTIRIATFNIQVFGQKKSSDKNIMPILAYIVSQFDVVAIQEVRSGDEPIRALVNLMRDSGAPYAATVSQPIGRTSQTESYAYLWDESRIRLVEQSAYVVQDPSDRMHREPMVASFETRVGTQEGRRPFRFTLINAHTSPSEVASSAIDNEMNVLDDVFVRVRQYDYEVAKEEDCILLGDLNVDVEGLRELGQLPNVESVAGDIKTNTRGTRTYDHIVIDRTLTKEYTGRYGMLDLQQDLGLSEEQALKVSDHQPVWAEFSVYETPHFEPVANAPTLVR